MPLCRKRLAVPTTRYLVSRRMGTTLDITLEIPFPRRQPAGPERGRHLMSRASSAGARQTGNPRHIRILHGICSPSIPGHSRQASSCKRRRSVGAAETFLPNPDEHRGFPAGCKRANCYRGVTAEAPEFNPISGLDDSEFVDALFDSAALLPARFAVIGNSSFNFRKCFSNRFQLSHESTNVTAVANRKNSSCAGTCDPDSVKSALGSKTKSRSRYLTGWLNR